jgi:solute carrier family 25 iron transporter 28/37
MVSNIKDKILGELEEEDFDFEGKNDGSSFLVHMFAGSIAGLMEHVAIFPIDTIKVKINLNIKTHMQTSKTHTKFREITKNIYLNGGFTRFWKGSLVIGSASIPAHALYFSVYEFAKLKLGVDNAVNYLFD